MDRTDYKYNLEYRAAVRAELASLATALLDGKLGVIAAARELKRFGYGLEPELDELIVVFVAIDSDTDALPVGQERAYWNAQALAQEDKKILSAEAFYRETARTAANQLIAALSKAPELGRPSSIVMSSAPTFQRLRDIGWSLWDPLGLRNSREAGNEAEYEDEYDRYLLQVIHRLRRYESVRDVADYLVGIERDMGMGSSPSAHDRATATVNAIKTYLETQPD